MWEHLGPPPTAGHPRNKGASLAKQAHLPFCEIGAMTLLPAQPSLAYDLFQIQVS